MIFKGYVQKLLTSLADRTEESGNLYFIFGIYGLINYVSVYPWWVITYHTYVSPYFFRYVFGVLLCVGLLLKKHWPIKIKEWFPLYFYFCVFYILPFSSTYFFLDQHSTESALLNVMLAIVLLFLVVDWVGFFILLVLGMFFGYLYYFLKKGAPTLTISDYKSVFFAFLWTIIAGALFSRNASRHRLNFQLKKQLETIQTICASIAHELRTPLRTIQSGANGFKKYLPQLLETYDIAKKENLPIPKINIMHQQALMSALNNINTEILASFTFIDMLLTNVNENSIGKNLKICSIEQCVQVALDRYPFNENERKLVNYDIKHNFQFNGNEELMIHVFFNLLKNALYYLKEANKGEISIWTEVSHKYNILHFKDTGKGIDEKVLPHIFDRFFSRTYHGTGIGLAFCKLVMQSFGGDIRCHSVVDEYADFIMTFPKHI